MEIRYKTSYKLSAFEVFEQINQHGILELAAEGVKVSLIKAGEEGALALGSLINVEISGLSSPLLFIVTACNKPDRVVLHTREGSSYRGEWHIDFISVSSGCVLKEKLIFFPKNFISRIKLNMLKTKISTAFKSKSLELKSRLLK